MASQQTHADRIARSLKRLGFQLSRTGRTFKVIDKAAELAVGSGPTMTLADIEKWIGEYISQEAEGTTLDTTPIATAITRLIAAGVTECELVARVARQFPDLSAAELSQALQVATATAERRAAGTVDT